MPTRAETTGHVNNTTTRGIHMVVYQSWNERSAMGREIFNVYDSNQYREHVLTYGGTGLFAQTAEGTAVTDNKLPADAKDHMIGKEFLRLSYVSTKTKPDGSNRWKDWQDTAKLGDEDLLKDNFTKAVDDGYVKDFCHPVHGVNGSMENQHVEADLPL